MKTLHTLGAVAALAMALPTLSLAQAAPDPTMAPAQTMPMPADQNMATPPAAPSASTAGMNTSSGPIPADQLPPGQANALAGGDNRMVTNGPVPDTRANRTKYGKPMSNAGKKTKPIGN
ncbi:MAG TPA: hypothetical protein VIJ59_03280 [Caulobacteraceae bacterium]